MPSAPYNRGLTAAILAFAIWGFFPIYWKLLSMISPIELLFVRLIITAATCLLLLPLRGTLGLFIAAWKSRQVISNSLVAAILLSGNWFSFIWAVNSGNVLESSLGYFLCPLVTVLLGRILLNESLNRYQWIAVFLAGSGVCALVLLAGRIPIAALVIALTWSGYGFLKKRSKSGPVVGLGLETCLLTPVSIIALASMTGMSPLAITTISLKTVIVLAFSGVLTATPLLLFAYAAPRVRLSTLGMGQYIVPSCHFLLACLYGEEVNPEVLAGFAMIWTGLALYAASGNMQRKQLTHSGIIENSGNESN